MQNADYLKYDIDPRQESNYPLDWKKFFTESRPLAVEIGCGNGEYLVRWAVLEPSWNYVGIEMSLASCDRSQQRIYQQGLKNIRLLRDEARFALREFFADKSVHHIVLNFPDPWPKDKHRDRRIYFGGFTSTVAAVLVDDGKLDIYTDQLWYAQEAREVFRKLGAFSIEEVQKDPERLVSTKYERKWRENFRDVYHFRAVKKHHVKIERILKDTVMPHYFIEKNIKSLKIEKLSGYELKRDKQVFKIKEVYRRKDRQSFLMRTVAVDGDYLQNFFILAAVHEKGTIIKIDAGFQPYRTPAVKMAVEEIGKLLN
jgi:tRNA (guanine-N7-)-methyltransferase